MTDIVERLRNWEAGACMRPALYDEAADEIERLRERLDWLDVGADKEIERLREDLRLGMIKAGTTILDKEAEIERLQKALRSSCDEQRQLFRDEANMPCEAAVDNEVLRGLLREFAPYYEEYEDDFQQRIREALGND